MEQRVTRMYRVRNEKARRKIIKYRRPERVVMFSQRGKNERITGRGILYRFGCIDIV